MDAPKEDVEPVVADEPETVDEAADLSPPKST